MVRQGLVRKGLTRWVVQVIVMASHIAHTASLCPRNARQYVLADYADEGTRMYYEKANTRLFGLIKPGTAVGPVLSGVHKAFGLHRLKMVQLDAAAAARFGAATGPAVALEASLIRAGSGVGDSWMTFCESQGLYGAVSGPTATADADFCFGKLPAAGRAARAISCCLVKPHAVAEGLLGVLVDELEGCGLTVEAMEMTTLDVAGAESFFDVCVRPRAATHSLSLYVFL